MSKFEAGLGYTPVLSYDSGVGEAGSEVVSQHDGKLYVTNGAAGQIDVIDIATDTLEASLDLTTISGYGGVNSVAASDAGIAVAIQNDDSSLNGFVAIYDINAMTGDDPVLIVEVGNLPDMVTYSKDGTQIYVANEGEPGSTDPAGSITIIDVASGTAQTFGFEDFDAQVEALVDAGVRVFPGELPSTDFEPEYISEGDDGNLYVTLQEANAVAVFDLTAMEFTEILPLGTQDHSQDGFGLDPNDKDGEINIHTATVEGNRMPDAIATVEIDGTQYFLTANEGDDRGDYDEGGDAARVGDIINGDVPGVSLDPSVDTTGLERLNVSIIDGDTDGDGDIDVLHSYGSRSFTIYDANGTIVFDSGDDFEQIIAQQRVPNAFNNDSFPSDDPDVVDENRSDNKGPEPEAIEVGVIDGEIYAFIGLERDSGIMVYNISDPANSEFVLYIDSHVNGDVSPEIIDFIAAEDSLSGHAQIAVSYEVSGTTTLIDLVFGENRIGDDTAQTFDGTSGADVIWSSGGDDTVFGNGCDDALFGQGGFDEIHGGDGNDEIWGGTGKARLYGDAGNDTLGGSVKNDAIFGGDGNDSVQGSDGSDTIGGDAGDDTLWGGSGDDTFYAGEGNDQIGGGLGSDLIYAGSGDDTVYAGQGADTVYGGSGDDEIWLGSGTDFFVFGGGNDTVGGFDANDAGELIDLSVMGIADLTELVTGEHMSQSGQHVVIDDLAGNTLTILNATLADLQNGDDFLF